MVRLPRKTETPPSEPPTGERLDSWKEIAAHFDRTVRTVQLWEKREGLRVHRHVHNKLGSVYAHRSELDAWWQNGRVRLDQQKEEAETLRPRWRRVVLVVAAPTLLLMAVLAGWYYRSLVGVDETPPGAEVGGIVLRRVPEPHEYFLLGRPAPDGRYIPFSDVDGDVAVFEIATGETRRLTNLRPRSNSGDFAYFSAVSPEGDRVAYGWYGNDTKRMDLRVVDIDGSGSRVVYRNDDLEDIHSVDWSADGKYILSSLSLTGGLTHLALVSPGDGSVRILQTLEGASPLGMSLSPDGRYLAYDRPAADDALTRDIYLLDTASRREILLVQHPANDVSPLWAADGETLVFGSDRAGTFGVWTLRLVDGRPQGPSRVVRKDIGRSSTLGLTRDGTLFYYFQAGMADVHVATLDPETGRIVDAPSVVGERFLGANLFCDWSPDGRHLAYVSERGDLSGVPGYRKLVVRSLETGEERVLSPKLPSFGHPRWSRDGRSIVARGADGGGLTGLFRIDLQTGDVERLARGWFPDFDFSPDGSSIIYWRDGYIFRRDMASGSERRLHGPDIFNIALSPDGRTVAFTQRARRLSVMSTSGGSPRQLLRSDDEFVLVQAWTRDGQALLFTRETDDGERTLWRIPASGGPARDTGLAGVKLGGLRFHPDGRQIAFVAGAPSLEVWVMENFLPVS